MHQKWATATILQREALTHCDAHAEQAADHLIDNSIQILVAGLPTVNLVVRIIPQAQAEEIGLCDNEVEVLIEDLRNMLRRAGGGYLRGKVLEKRPGNGGEEVHIGWGVEPLGKIACDGLYISLVGLDKVDDWNIGDWVSLGVDVPLNGLFVSFGGSSKTQRKLHGDRTDGWSRPRCEDR